jgi:cytosine deaminase
LAGVQVRRTCVIDNDTQSSTALIAAQFSGRCVIPAPATIVEVDLIGGTGVLTALVPGSMILLTASTVIGKNVYKEGFARNATDRQVSMVARGVLPIFALVAVYFVLRGGATIVSIAIFASSLLTQLLPSLLFSLMPRPFGNKQAAFAGILSGGAVLGYTMIANTTLAQMFPDAPAVFKSINIGLVALAINALVFTVVALLSRRATMSRNAMAVPALCACRCPFDRSFPMSLPDSLLLRNVRPLGAAPVDLLVKGDRIEAVGANLHAPADCIVEEGGGALLLPGLVEGHTHLDKTLWGMDWYRNEVGTRLVDKIDNERAFRAETRHDAASQSMVLAKAFLALGTTRLRTHVDIDTQAGLHHLEGEMRTRDALKDVQQIQIVAFPQSGMLGRPGTAELLDEAMAQGANVLGGLDPCAIDGDPSRSLDTLFGIAERHACPLDIHLHEPGAMGGFSLELILDRTAALGMQGKVAISHGFCLAELPERERDVLLARMAQLGVVLVTSAPPSRNVPSLMACRAAGVTVLGGNDGIRDTWSPYGNPDMLERAMLIGMRFNLRRDEELEIALDCVTHAGARGCGFADYGLAPGHRADLVLLDAQTVAQAVAARPPRRLVVAGGRIVARSNALLPDAVPA